MKGLERPRYRRSAVPNIGSSHGEYSPSAYRFDDLTDGIYDEVGLAELDVVPALLRDDLFPARRAACQFNL